MKDFKKYAETFGVEFIRDEVVGVSFSEVVKDDKKQWAMI